jgi:hypothetical protein
MARLSMYQTPCTCCSWVLVHASTDHTETSMAENGYARANKLPEHHGESFESFVFGILTPKPQVSVASAALFTGFSIGTALAPNLASFFIFRILTAFQGTAFLIIGSAVIGDIYKPVSSIFNTMFIYGIWGTPLSIVLNTLHWTVPHTHLISAILFLESQSGG